MTKQFKKTTSDIFLLIAMVRFKGTPLIILLAVVCQCKGRRIHQNPRRELRSNGSMMLENDIGRDSFVINHPNPVTQRNSFFSEGHCSPDENGYYGSTTGTASMVTFGFEVETTPDTDMSEVFHAILESVENALLTTFFPSLCYDGESSERMDVDPSGKLDIHGFRFDPAYNQYARSCTPMIDAINSCDVYAGTVRVYGEGQNALVVIRDHLDFDGTENVHPNVERIFSVTLSDSMDTVSEPANDDNSSSLIVGICVAVVTLSIGIVGLAVFQRRRRTRQSQVPEGCNASGTVSAVESQLAPYQDHTSNQDLEEVSDVEEIDLQSGSSPALHDCRPPHATSISDLV